MKIVFGDGSHFIVHEMSELNTIFNYAPEDIIRVEVNLYEFENKVLTAEGEFDKVCLSEDKDLSGSYVVYKGVCIQTHESYYL